MPLSVSRLDEYLIPLGQPWRIARWRSEMRGHGLPREATLKEYNEAGADDLLPRVFIWVRDLEPDVPQLESRKYAVEIPMLIDLIYGHSNPDEYLKRYTSLVKKLIAVENLPNKIKYSIALTVVRPHWEEPSSRSCPC